MRGDYAALGRPAEAERRRLEHLANRLNPISQRWLLERGIAPGWRCVEVGAAEGTMSRWMAEQVGPRGRVVAADIDVRFLEDLDAPNVEVRQLDLRSDGLEPETYDLAYCRTLLLHLDDPRAALETLVAALRPDGVLFVQEPDARSTSAVDLDHPEAEAFERLTHTVHRWLREGGWFDSYFGRRLPGLIGSLGLVDVGCDTRVFTATGGSEDTEIYKQTFAAMAQLLIAKGVVSESDLARLQRIYDDPSFEIVGDTQWGAWGRKPVG